jgi:CubicO group peptidase (beta-lactamase class C family)
MRVSTNLLLAVLFLCHASASVAAPDQTDAIGRLMSTLHERGQFNGCALVAVGDKVIYRNALGEANLQTHAKLTPQVAFCLASVSKQFTAIAIMMLAEQNKLSYDDRASRFIVELRDTPPLNQITIRQLLNHTSGIPDFGDLNMDDSGLTEEKLLQGLAGRAHVLGVPGERYRYSNPGYELLGIIVKRASGRSFNDFLEEKVFKPLGMTNTYINGNPPKGSAGTASDYDEFGQEENDQPGAIQRGLRHLFSAADAVVGDGGIYSTVDDLFKWSQALNTEQLVAQSTLAQAFTPGNVRKGTCSYGFGWNVGSDWGHRYVWHTGKTAGWRAFIERRLDEQITVILLTNEGESKRTEINECILKLLAGKGFVLPKRSCTPMLYAVVKRSGIDAALKQFDSMKQAQGADFDLGENELNTLGYKLLGDKRAGDSIAIFKLNTREHPGSSNAFDSLGDAYLQDGQKRQALDSYEKAVSLDPGNLHSAAMVKKLK